MYHINFEHNGRELTAEAETLYDDTNAHKMVLDSVKECRDAITGEDVPITKGIEASIIFALRSEWQEIEDTGKEDGLVIDKKMQIFSKKK